MPPTDAHDRAKPQLRPKSETIKRLTLQEARAEANRRRVARPVGPGPTPQMRELAERFNKTERATARFQRAEARRAARTKGTGIYGLPAYAYAPFSILAFGDPNIVQGARDVAALGRRAQEILQSPEASTEERVSAAAETALFAGGLFGGLVPKRKAVAQTEKAALLPAETVRGDRMAPAEDFFLGEAAASAKPKPAGAEKIVESLPEARKLRGQQEAGYRAERGKRAAAAERAAEEAGGGEASFRAARAQLRGELPKLSFTRLVKEFGAADSDLRAVLQPQKDELLDFIRAHPRLQGREYTVLNTQGALRKALRGEVPTRSEIRLLENVFGEEAAQHFKWLRARDLAVRVLNVPRSFKASYDLSAPFRQGLVLGARHPILFTRAWGPMLRAARSERGYKAIMDEIHARPSFKVMEDAKLQLTDLGSITTREEAYISDLAERVPIVGRGVRVSSRAYTGFLNKFRTDAFDLMLDHHPGASLRDIRGLASWINVATGRGGLGMEALEKAAPLLTLGFFSPRLIASRISLLNPAYYATLPRVAQKEAARGMLQLVAAGSLVLYLAKKAGADVSADPRNADFGKIRVGDTRVDIWGGFQQYVVNGWRIAVKESVSSTTGEVKTLEGGFATPSRRDIFEDFARGKAAPVPGFVLGSLAGKKPSGEEFSEAKEAGRIFLPLGLENAYEGFTAPGGSVPAGLASLGLGSIGFGVQTYGAQSDSAYKEQLRAISKAVRRGEIDESTAQELRASAKAAYEQVKLEARLRREGRSEEEINRLLVIDLAKREGMGLEELNALLVELGYPPATAGDL